MASTCSHLSCSHFVCLQVRTRQKPSRTLATPMRLALCFPECLLVISSKTLLVITPPFYNFISLLTSLLQNIKLKSEAAAAQESRSKTEPILAVENTQRAPGSKQVIRPGQNLAEMFQTEGKKALKEKADQALVEFIICCDIPPHVLQKRHFREFVNALNGKYMPPSRTTFEDSLVPSYAAAVRVTIINHLKECWDLMLSFDGGKLGKKRFYSIHATTPNRQSFCLDLDDVTRLSQTGEYIYELLKKVHYTHSRFIVNLGFDHRDLS